MALLFEFRSRKVDDILASLWKLDLTYTYFRVSGWRSRCSVISPRSLWIFQRTFFLICIPLRLIWGKYRSIFRCWSMLLLAYGITETWIFLHKQCTCTITYCYVVRGRLHSLQEKELIEQYENMGIG